VLPTRAGWQSKRDGSWPGARRRSGRSWIAPREKTDCDRTVIRGPQNLDSHRGLRTHTLAVRGASASTQLDSKNGVGIIFQSQFSRGKLSRLHFSPSRTTDCRSRVHFRHGLPGSFWEAKSLIACALRRVEVNQCGWPASLSKRAPSTTRPSLRLWNHTLAGAYFTHCDRTVDTSGPKNASRSAAAHRVIRQAVDSLNVKSVNASELLGVARRIRPGAGTEPVLSWSTVCRTPFTTTASTNPSLRTTNRRVLTESRGRDDDWCRVAGRPSATHRGLSNLTTDVR
jgi:hypothetical protein